MDQRIIEPFSNEAPQELTPEKAAELGKSLYQRPLDELTKPESLREIATFLRYTGEQPIDKTQGNTALIFFSIGLGLISMNPVKAALSDPYLYESGIQFFSAAIAGYAPSVAAVAESHHINQRDGNLKVSEGIAGHRSIFEVVADKLDQIADNNTE